MGECAKCDFVDYMSEGYGDWASIEYDAESRKVTEFGRVELVDSFFDPIVGGGYYGEGCHDQGHQGDVYMVFKDGDKFFKVSGTSNSYADCVWHSVKEVVGKIVQKTVYEFKEAN